MRLSKKQAAAFGLNIDSKPRPKTGTPLSPAPQGMDVVFDALCLAHGLPKPEHEVHFAERLGRKFAFDHLFEHWLAVEIEGGIFGRGKPCPLCKRRPPGAHSSVERLKSDMEKYNLAVILGYAVIRCLPEDVGSGAVFETIKKALKLEKP